MDTNDYQPRRSQKARRGHPLRNTLVVLVLLALAALCIVKFVLPLTRSLPSPSSGSSAQSGQVDTSAQVPTDETTSLPASDTDEDAPADTPAQEEPVPEADTPDTEIDLLMLVNSTHSLPEGYQIELTELSNRQQVASVLYPALQQMFNDARSQGIYPIVASGYRTAEKQQSLMDEKIQALVEQGYAQDDAAAEALKWVNPVGCSEHQSGLAVDINADGVHSAGNEVYAWLAENAWRYGFILRYPEGKTDLTGTGYEPWHYRYVGLDAAAEIQQQGVCLEEYLG